MSKLKKSWLNSDIFKYRGAIHIHTVKSDGTGDIRKVAKAAKKAGLSWIIVTDHNYIDNDEGIIDGVIVIKGQEVSSQYNNHYLVIGTDKLFLPKQNLQETINEVNTAKGFGFAAHPDESKTRKNSHNPITWLDKSIEPNGIEIWNMFSNWGDNYNSENLITSAYSYFFKNNLITKPCNETLEWWDKLNLKYADIIPAIGGVDAHELIVKRCFVPLKIFPYEYSFKTITNEVILKEKLSNDFNTAKNQIINAIKSGNNVIFNKIRYDDEFDFNITNSNSIVYAGAKIKLDDLTFLNINLNKDANILVFKDGLKYNEIRGKTFKIHLIEKGKYRIEVRIKGFGAIYTNPIIID